MPQQLSDVVDPVPAHSSTFKSSIRTKEYLLDHRRPLQTQAPPVNPHALRKAHGLQHLRPKHAAVPDFHPLVQPLVEPKDLQARLRVRIVRRLETQLVDAHLRVKDLHEANQPAQRQAPVRNDAFDLVKLGQMRRVDRLVAEDAVDGEVARSLGVGGELVEHGGRGGGGVGAEHEAERFVLFPRVTVPDRAVLSRLVHVFDVLPVLLVALFQGKVLVERVGARRVGSWGVGDVEGVLEVASGVLLGDVEGIKVPESGFDVTNRWKGS